MSASRPSGFCVGSSTTSASSRICFAAQSERSASSHSTRSDASVPLSSPPCTLPAIHRIAGSRRAIAARVARPGRRIHQLRGRGADAREAGRRHPVRIADDRVAQVAALDRLRQRAGDDPRRRGVDRGDVRVGLRGGHVALAEVDPDHLLRRRHLAAERRRPERVARRRRGDGRTGPREQRPCADREHEHQTLHPASPEMKWAVLRRRGIVPARVSARRRAGAAAARRTSPTAGSAGPRASARGCAPTSPPRARS